MPAYYNENDPKAAAWLRELIREGHIAPGVVDERSILDVTPMDVAGYDQCHFFAGIGGWSYALRLAGWEDTRGVWTGSCPCQPFSAAGKAGGFADERHLWPHWHHLIRIAKPDVIFGEQVASKDGLAWFDLVHSDLEAEGYAFGVADLCAAGVGAPHIRQRLYFVAHNGRAGLEERRFESARPEQPPVERSGEACDMAIAEGQQQHGRGNSRRGRGESADCGELGYADTERQQQHAKLHSDSIARAITPPCWADIGGSSYIDCRDGKARPVEPGTFPLAHGIPHRVGLLRGYGNAIVAPLASEFIAAYCASRE